MGGECCPYGSQCILVTAQVLMGIIFFVSFAGWYLTWVCGLIAWILVLLLACTKVPRAVLITSGVFAMIAAIGQFILAGLAKTLNVYCTNTTDDTYGGQYDSSTQQSCNSTVKTIRVLAVITGIGWVISSVLVIYLSVALKDKVDRTQSAWARPGEPKQPVGASGGAAGDGAAGTVTTETIQLPDGSTKIKETRVNADGSQTITERIVAPARPPTVAATPIVTVQAEDDVEQQGVKFH